MMRRLFSALFALLLIGAAVGSAAFLYRKSKVSPTRFATAPAEHRDIVRKTVAPGALVPRREVAIKSRVSGVVEKVYVESGSQVKRGTPLARIRVIPDVVRLNEAQAGLRAAELNLQTAKTELARQQSLRLQGVLSEAALAQQQLSFELWQQQVEAAESNLELIRYGASEKSGAAENLVRSTLEGTVLEVPVKEGVSVIEANTFNEGTTIANIADMSDLVFQGNVDELEAGRLEPGMPVSILIGAIGAKRLSGTLEHVAPKGIDNQGTIQFEIRVRVTLEPELALRANYSANADIILERRSGVLALNEAWIVYQKGEPFVDVETDTHEFERRAVVLGVSDGIWSEVTSGVAAGERVKTGAVVSSLE